MKNSKQQTANSKQQTANSKQQTANSKQQTANSKQQTANSKQQTANSKQRLYSLVILAALTLITACETPEPKSSAANITQLTLTVGGEEKTVSFNDKREATLTLQYAFGQDAPTTAIVKSISLSSKATATVTSAGTLAITNNKASITVTAEDGTKLTYTIAFTFTQQSPFTTLVLTIGSQDSEVTFDQTQQATVAYQYPFGGDPPTTATVKNISTADNTTASVADGGILTIADNQVTITVTAQNGTAKDYTINIDFTQAPGSSAKEITALTLQLGGQDKEVTFDPTQQATVAYQYSFGEEPPATATVQRISTSADAVASVAQGEILAIADNEATITVTAQDGTTQTYTLTFNFTQVDGNTLKAITKLVIALGGAAETVAFNNENEATIAQEFPFGTTLPTTFTVTEITVSPQAATTVSNDATITIADNKATITVTAQDGTTQTYTLLFELTNTPASSAKEITALTLQLGGQDKEVIFDPTQQATVTHQYPFGENPPATATVQRISTSADAAASVAQGEMITIADNEATITVTAQDGTTQTYTLTFNFTQVDGNTLKAITKLVIALGGAAETVAFNNENEATIAQEFPFGTTLPTTFTVTEITVSPQAATTVSNDATITIADNKATITVTAQDGTTQTYTLNFNLTTAPNTAAAITTLVLTLGGEEKTVAFNENRSDTVTHQVPFGTAQPTTFMVNQISVSIGAVVDVTPGKTYAISNGQIAYITVTSQDGNNARRYTIIFTLTTVPNTAAEITALMLTLGGVDKTVTFDENRRGTVTHQFPIGAALPTQATVKEITLSQGATATVASNETLTIAEDNTITVTAQDGTTLQTYTLFFELTQAPDPTLRGVVVSGSIPANLSTYSEVARAVLAPYTAGATVVANYVTVAGAGTKDGSSWDNAADAENLKSTLDGIGDASSSKVYLLLVAAGSYDAGAALSMKNNVAIVGGWEPTGGWGGSETDTTVFSGGDTHQVVNNNGLNRTAVLYGAKITAGKFNDGGGMYNSNASPTLNNLTFEGNSAFRRGGGMANVVGSSPTLNNVTFKRNTGGVYSGMYNNDSSPTLNNVTFIAHELVAMYSQNNASPTLVNVTFIANSYGMYNVINASPTLINVTFIANGNGMYNSNDNDNNGQTGPVVVNCLFWGNTSPEGNAQIALANDTGSDRGAENITLAYSVIQGGADSTALATTENGNPVNITATGIVTTDPMLGMLADNGGSVQTVAIASGSTAQNIGVYVRRSSDGTFYYSEDNSTWYTSITAEGLADTATPPADAEDLTATDATGTARSGRPDAGAYEAR